ncbi:hypothetical protein QTP88_027923 [Uroleucon formosanum]
MNIASHSAQTNKRNLSSSSNSASEPSTPNPNKNIILTNHKKKIFVTRNRFEVFAQDDSFETNTNENIPNSHQTNTNSDANTFTKPPPPIFVKGVEDYPELCTTLIELIGVDNFMCKSTTNSLKIQTTDPSAYRALIQFLKTEKAEYHTYQLNEDKPLRVVIRNLHSSTPLTLIKEELEVRCFEVRQVTNVLHKVNKNPLPLFFIDLEPTLQSNEIFQLSSLLHCKIKVEEPYKPKQISQCFNCQQYGHTRGYCGYHPRCVRCGADHQSSTCPNSRDVPPKCVHCSQNHPANYKGCSIYKELQRRKIPSAPILAPPDPTYWPSSSRKNPDILDIFVTKIPNNLFSTTKNLLDLNSDHSSVLLTLNTSPTYKESNKLFNKYTDHSKFTELVDKEIHLNIKLKTPDDIDLAIHNLTNVIQTAAWSATSTFLALPTSDPLPVTIRNKIVEKRRARALFQRTRLPSHKLNYNNLANSLKKMLAKIKANVWQNHLMKLTPKDGSLWRETKQILRYKSPNLPIKKSDGSLAISDFEKAELFKEHLSQTFQPHSEIIDNENMNTVETFLNASLPLTLPVKSFTPNDVKYAILKYSLNKSPGYDRITAEVARSLPTRAIVHITHIFNASLRLSYFPLLWKFSTIILFPKPNKPPDIPSSHRPISLLPFFAKILERLILKRIIPIITQKNILPNTQFGFRASHSTTHQVHRVVDAISYSLEKKLYCNCVFLDIAQAFDRVWHDGLLYKLKKFLPPTYYLLIKSYLTDRFFQVRHGSALSDLASINAGVPQGGILSPILYNIFASDQPITPNTSVADFADDKALISINNNPILASINLQTHLNAMEKWFTKWRFKVNQNKSVHTTFTLRHTPCPGVVLYGIPIPYSPKIKYLGLTLDQRLTWAHHIRTKRLALNHRLRLLKPLLYKIITPLLEPNCLYTKHY